MEIGRLPCQEDALREAIAARQLAGEAQGSSRRMWLSLVATALCSGAVGYWLRPLGGWGRKGLDPRILWARRMASEETPIEELLANSEGFVRQLIARSYEDPIVWAGIARICIALEDDVDALDSERRRLVAFLIAATIRVAKPPENLQLSQYLVTLDRISK